MVCMTLRIRLNDLEDAEKAYLERFGHAAPEHIHGAQYADDIERTKFIKRAVGQNMPLSASEYGIELKSLEEEYSTRFQGYRIRRCRRLKQKVVYLQRVITRPGDQRALCPVGSVYEIANQILVEHRYCKSDVTMRWAVDHPFADDLRSAWPQTLMCFTQCFRDIR